MPEYNIRWISTNQYRGLASRYNIEDSFIKSINYTKQVDQRINITTYTHTYIQH